MMIPRYENEYDIVDYEIPNENSTQPWRCCRRDVPSNEVVYFTQIFIVYIIIMICIVNLALGRDPHDLWITLLSSSIGYVLPSPTMKRVALLQYHKNAVPSR